MAEGDVRMNFLAHALLAGAQPADQLGGLMGDFVKGPLPAGLPHDLAAGVRLHRMIDVYAETHPAFMRSRARVSAQRRRVAGVMVDMFYDHFLARHWLDYHAEPLAQFAARMYALMAEHAAMLPPRLVEILPHMRDGDWFVAYRSADVTADAIDRMSRRLSRPELLYGGGDELGAHYPGFEADFFEFIDDAIGFARIARTRINAAE